MTTTKRRASRASPKREPAFEELAKRVDEAVRTLAAKSRTPLARTSSTFQPSPRFVSATTEPEQASR